MGVQELQHHYDRSLEDLIRRVEVGETERAAMKEDNVALRAEMVEHVREQVGHSLSLPPSLAMTFPSSRFSFADSSWTVVQVADVQANRPSPVNATLWQKMSARNVPSHLLCFTVASVLFGSGWFFGGPATAVSWSASVASLIYGVPAQPVQPVQACDWCEILRQLAA